VDPAAVWTMRNFPQRTGRNITNRRPISLSEGFSVPYILRTATNSNGIALKGRCCSRRRLGPARRTEKPSQRPGKPTYQR